MSENFYEMHLHFFLSSSLKKRKKINSRESYISPLKIKKKSKKKLNKVEIKICSCIYSKNRYYRLIKGNVGAIRIGGCETCELRCE